MQTLREMVQAPPPPLHPATEVGTVTLKVADMARSLQFYTGMIGLQVLSQGDSRAWLGAGGQAILSLEHVPGARRQPPNTTGLYHAAILLPTRHALAVKVMQLVQNRVQFGYGDHLVSEAFYLDDPDGNGLEIYADRPRETWPRVNGQIRMASDPVVMDSLFGELAENDPALATPAVPSGTKLGHMHLRVADIPAAEAFYVGVLGFDVVARWPGALFVSAGGYHHHIGMNTWQSLGGKPPVEPSAGLRAFTLRLPDEAEQRRLIGQVEAAGYTVEDENGTPFVTDPFGNPVGLEVANPSGG